MKWRKTGEYSAISDCGAYRISKTLHSGNTLFTLWHREKTVGMYDSMAVVNAAVANHKGNSNA